ncbi:MAG: DNA methyltransferase [Thermodesulfobacteriota bacterium]
MAINLNRARNYLQNFDFSRLFIEELGWSNPTSRQIVPMGYKDGSFTRRQVAQLAGVVAFEITSSDGKIPDTKTRAALHKEIATRNHENLLIFVDKRRAQSLWYWVKRKDGKMIARDHIYVKGQPGDLFLSKLNSMVFDISDFDESGNISLLEVTGRLKEALDIERVIKRFYNEFDRQHLSFLELIEGIDSEHDRRWYASVLLNRLMFIYFLQRKFFLDNGDGRYMQNKLLEMQKTGHDLYYLKFLKTLFFEGFAKPLEGPNCRSVSARALLGHIKYLNGGLFLLHPVEQRWPKIFVPDRAFENLFALFERYSWNLNDTIGGQDDEINPDVLGYIYEKYINQKAFGAYYTRPEITLYLCERTIHKLILDGINTSGIPGIVPARRFDSVGDLLLNLDADLCRNLLYQVLPNLRLLDPACGSAAFLVAAMKTLINIYAAVIGKIEFLNDRNLKSWLEDVKKKHPSVNYFIKKMIITENLFGVDIMEEAVEIAKLRLFLALVAAADTVDDLEPLPNIDFNILTGNSLIGFLRVNDQEFDNYHKQMHLFRKSYRQVVDEKNRLIRLYRSATSYAEDLRAMRDKITSDKQAAIDILNDILLGEFNHLKIKYEQATWDERKNTEGKPIKRALKFEDLEVLKPFHWGFEFDEILNQRGGFDAIITNPPWEIFKPNAKEFFEEFSDLVTKKKMNIKDFEKEKAQILKDPDIRKAWLKYLSDYPHVSAFFRSAEQYQNQISLVGGKKAGTDINLYKLFTELCFNLLRDGGYCGIVIPSGIYTDLGTKQLREMLFTQTKLTGLFCFENRKEIFEGVHRSYKFLVLTFEKGDQTDTFPAAFMRLDVQELDHFPQEGAINVSVELVRRLSPDSLSIMEFKNSTDIFIAEKMLRFPPLGNEIQDCWNLKLTAEFHMTNDSSLFKTAAGKDRLPLFEGKMIHQFIHNFTDPRFWISEKDGRAAQLKRGKTDHKQLMAYQNYRLGFRDVARNTDERTMISTVIPQRVFAGNTLITSTSPQNPLELLTLVSLLNSFSFDYFIRQKVTAHCNMFYVFQVPMPRLTKKDPAFWPIVTRAARLICTTQEFDDLAKEVGLKSHNEAATDPVERGRLRAELDGLIAHLYGLTEEEFAYILTTFPLVPDPVKIAAHNAFRNVEKGLIK